MDNIFSMPGNLGAINLAQIIYYVIFVLDLNIQVL